MKYSKREILKFTDGKIAIVLKDGIEGPDFINKYLGQPLNIMNPNGVNFLVKIHDGLSKGHVWYNVLVGDINVWSTHYSLYIRITGMLPFSY